jgi:hypothetical protein
MIDEQMATEEPPTEPRPVTQVEFGFSSGPYPFVAASETLGCEFELAEMIPRRGDRYSEFFNVSDVDPQPILDGVTDHGAVEARLLREFENGGLFEFVVSANCPAVELAEQGALPRAVHGSDGTGRIVAEIPPRYDPGTIVDSFLEKYPDGELVCKRTEESFTPIFTESTVEELLQTALTERQQEVLRAAFDAGYYEWPRERTGEDIAAALDISSATFSEHIHAAERNLLAALFEAQ